MVVGELHVGVRVSDQVCKVIQPDIDLICIQVVDVPIQLGSSGFKLVFRCVRERVWMTLWQLSGEKGEIISPLLWREGKTAFAGSKR